MDWSSEQALITSLQVGKLRHHRGASQRSADYSSMLQNEMGALLSRGEPTDTRESRALALGWQLAMAAQSCAYLADELQIFAERLSTMQITCPESTYRRLYDSGEMLLALLENMRQNYVESNAQESDQSLPVLSLDMAQVIRSTLAQERVTTMVASTINTDSREYRSIETAGDMK